MRVCGATHGDPLGNPCNLRRSTRTPSGWAGSSKIQIKTQSARHLTFDYIPLTEQWQSFHQHYDDHDQMENGEDGEIERQEQGSGGGSPQLSHHAAITVSFVTLIHDINITIANLASSFFYKNVIFKIALKSLKTSITGSFSTSSWYEWQKDQILNFAN